MYKTCVCGKRIQPKHDLCSECLSLYGTDKSEWPEWLSFMVSDIRREYNYECRHDDLEFNEEVDYSNPNAEFEDVLWDD
jgi:hypothetical protein